MVELFLTVKHNKPIPPVLSFFFLLADVVLILVSFACLHFCFGSTFPSCKYIIL